MRTLSISSIFLTTVLLFGTSAQAYAEGQGVGPFTVVSIKVDAAHVGITLNSTFTDMQCNQESQRVMLLPSDPGFANLYAALLTAANNNRKVSFWIEGCSSSTAAFWGYRWPIARNVAVVFP